MTEQDRLRWDARYAERTAASADDVGLPSVFLPVVDAFPTSGQALDLACGQGLASVWLARRGLQVRGVDVSPVAVDQARALAQRRGVAARCRFDVADLDDGLPPGPPVDVLLCLKFRDPRLDRALLDRLAPGGLLAITTLSEVGAEPGPFRAAAGELASAFAGLTLVTAGERDGQAWLLAVNDQTFSPRR